MPILLYARAAAGERRRASDGGRATVGELASERSGDGGRSTTATQAHPGDGGGARSTAIDRASERRRARVGAGQCNRSTAVQQ